MWVSKKSLFLLLLLGLPAAASAAEDPFPARQPDVPYVQTPMESVHRMLELGRVERDDYVIDLGSGDGRIVISAVQDWGARQGLGVEIDPLLVTQSRQSARRAGVDDRVTFITGDLFELDFSDASVLTLFLLQPLNNRLRPVILDSMAPGSRVVSHVFTMEDWQPDDADDYLQIYMWVVPARVAGDWRIERDDDVSMTLSLNQRYQEIDGYAIVNGDWVPLSNAQLEGARIQFDVLNTRYVGRVEGDRITPVAEPGSMRHWRAYKN